MNAPGLDHLPKEHADTWASETLPMSVRRELLERELKKLGFGKNEAGAASRPGGSMQQQQPQGAAGLAQADADNGGYSS